jgi:ApeA N-terminal domain 1
LAYSVFHRGDRNSALLSKLGNRSTDAVPRYFDCVANFIELRGTFGSIWETWRSKREEFGSGFYLYLGTRRGMRLYVEHRIANLVWGVEAFHRTKYPTPATSRLRDKIDRVVSQIRAKKDKEWLTDKLKTPTSRHLVTISSKRLVLSP